MYFYYILIIEKGQKRRYKIFWKKIGIGSIIIGFTIIIAGVLTILNYVDIANIVLVIGFIVGFIIIFYLLFKYNNGIFLIIWILIVNLLIYKKLYFYIVNIIIL